MNKDSIKIMFLKQEFVYTPGDTLLEIAVDNIDNNLNGIIDEISIYDRVLSPTEILDNYNNLKP